METDNIITVLAILISPLLAIQVTRFLDHQAEKRERREAIFRTLMSTRARNLDAEHVDALNSIDVEFYGQQKEGRKGSSSLEGIPIALGYKRSFRRAVEY